MAAKQWPSRPQSVDSIGEESDNLQRDFTTLPKDATVKVESVTKRGDRILDLEGIRFQIGQRVAEELLAALSRSLRPYAGYSIFDCIMQDLDAVLDRLMAGEPAEDGRDPGRAEAYTKALATIRNPYEPDYPAEKDRQMERWEKRNAE
jgi:hypothetical protein